MRRSSRAAFVAAIVVAGVTLVGERSVCGQDVPQPVDTFRPQTTPAVPGLTVEQRRSMAQALTRAKKLLGAGEYADGLGWLQREVFDRSEDFFSDAEQDGAPLSLKQEGLELLDALPDEGHRVYELLYGVMAQQMLDAATEARSVAQLEDVTRRFFHSRAGYEATYRLGTYYFDRSEPLTAVLFFERLRKKPRAAKGLEPMLSLKTALCWDRSGMPSECIRALVELKEASSQGTILLGGRRVALFDRNEQALDWLATVVGDQPQLAPPTETAWLMLRGNPSRDAVSAAASPLWETAWQVDAFDSVEEFHAERIQLLKTSLKELGETSNALTLPAMHPLLVGDVVVFRTFRNLKAVRLSTGELLWETAVVDPAFEALMQQDEDLLVGRGPFRDSPLDAFLKQRGWRDLTACTLSSDGHHVFALEELGFIGPFFNNPQGIRHPMAPNDFNKLVAFEVESGKFLWEIGGSRGPHELDFAGMFFLGPPLPLGNLLYCLVEESGEIRLLVLEPVELDRGRWSVRLSWSQGIADADPVPNYSIGRRQSGISPSFSNGVLVCPTGSGAVVALDPARRMLLWKYNYRETAAVVLRNQRALILAQRNAAFGYNNDDDENRWIDSVATIAGGRVLLTPRDSNDLHCLNLIDGSAAWSRPRDQALYLAGVYGQTAIIAERAQLRALKLSDGTDAWKQNTPIPTPSGRGFRNDNFYRIPLSSGEIATIDLRDGRIVARSRARDDAIPGNLVAVGGRIVSQTADTVTGFRSLDELQLQFTRSLEKNPADSSALALRGELRLHLGQEEDGIADLRRAFELKPDSRIRHLLVDRLLEGVRLDFARYRQSTEEIERLVEDPQQRSAFLRLYAAGLQSLGEHRAAFSSYLKLAGPDTGEPTLDRIDGTISVRSDRWVRARIAELYAKSTPDERRVLDREIEAQLNVAIEHSGIEPLKKFLHHFGRHPVATKARRQLAERLDGTRDAIDLEMQLLQLRDAGSPENAGFATARLVSLLIDLERADEAPILVDQLRTRWEQVPCLNGKTGRQLAEGWLQDPKIREEFTRQSPWLQGRVAATMTERNEAVDRFFPVEVVGPRPPFFEDWSLELDQTRRFVIGRDGQGKVRWQLESDETGSSVPSIYGNYVQFSGHLMVLVLGNRFAVFDTFHVDEFPKMLWKHGLYDDQSDEEDLQAIQVRQFDLPGRARRFSVMDRMGRPIGTVCLVSEELLCYQVGTQLYAAEPLTGETLWVRNNVPRGSELFGDGEYVFAVDRITDQAFALRAADGEKTDVRPFLPAVEGRLFNRGRRVLSWRLDDGAHRLTQYDVVSGRAVWQESFAADAVATLIEDEEVAVLEPQGRLVIVRIDDGSKVLESKLNAQADVARLMVLRSRERYVVLATSPMQNPNVFRVIGIGMNTPIVNGWVYGFDRTSGEKLWSTRVEHQALETDQPEDLPVLVFTCRLYQPLRPGGAQVFNPNQYSVLVLDKRNGQILLQNKGERPLSTFLVEAKPEKQQIEVAFYQSLITLKLTDEPLDNAKKPGGDEKPSEKPSEKPKDK